MNLKASKKIGIKDIAAKAGVSIGTVDRVLHKRRDVSEATRRKVLKIVKELDYHPNIIAQALSSKKPSLIAIVIPDCSDRNPYWEIPIQGIRKAAEELKRFNVEILYEFFDASDQSSYRTALAKVLSEKLDGIVLNPVFHQSTLDHLENFKEENIPYVFIDVNIKGVGKLGYFGQDAEQSGRVAGNLLDSSVEKLSDVLIIKQSSRKIFSQHIEARVKGFLDFFNKDEGKSSEINPIVVEIDLLEKDEPEKSLNEMVEKHPDIKAVFIPNSRVFLFADFLEKKKLQGYKVTGYDIITENKVHLQKGNISYLICQKPEHQAYLAIMALFNYHISKKEMTKINYSPIDIINKENIKYY